MSKVSIITPLFNGEKTISRAIESVQAQTFDDYEHLIIDNLSKDNGPAIVKEYARKDPRIKFLSQNGIPSAAITRNLGMMHSTGRYIAFLDCDDYWLPNKLEKQLYLLEQRGFVFCWSAYDVCDEAGVVFRTQKTKTEIDRQDFLRKNCAIGCLTAIYDQEQLGRFSMIDGDLHEDFCLWADILSKADDKGLAYGGCDDVLAVYTVMSKSKSSNKVQAARMHWNSLRDHLQMNVPDAIAYFIWYAINAIRAR